MSKQTLCQALPGLPAGRLARITGMLLCMLLALLAVPANTHAGDSGRPGTLRILYAANACGIVQPCPT